jgi:hypothetical protein
MNEVAHEFLKRCFREDETIALLLRNENPVRVQQRLVILKQALAPRYMAWLAYENTTGANVYVAANPLRPGSRRRTKEAIAEVRHLYLDIDADGETRLAAVRASDTVPQPSIILNTSPNKFQVLWRVEGFDSAAQEETLKRLALAFGGDPACTDCNRVLRIPGFLNQKYSPAHRVNVEYGFDRVSSPSDFRLPEFIDLVAPNDSRAHRIYISKDSRSEQDWAWVCHEIEAGHDPSKLTHELARRRSDKPNPLYYAQRTVDIASARDWFLAGAPFDDVTTMLECRRRFELPSSLCASRAREIATTAQRMVRSSRRPVSGVSATTKENRHATA